MTRKHLLHDGDMPTHEGASMFQGVHRGPQVGLWLTATESARYTGRTVKAFYEWRKRKGLVPVGDGRFSRRDLDLALAQPRKRRVMAAASLANLRKGR